jgi:hypothetical protein
MQGLEQGTHPCPKGVILVIEEIDHKVILKMDPEAELEVDLGSN